MTRKYLGDIHFRYGCGLTSEADAIIRHINTMKKLIEQIDGEGFEALLGENVLVFAMNYLYDGKLIGVNDTCILIQNARIVYETGGFSAAEYKDAQALPTNLWYIQTASIESFGRSGK